MLKMIEDRNAARGRPSAVSHTDALLNTRQVKLLESLPYYNSQIVVSKSDVSMKDLSAMTAKTGDEFAMFTRDSERLIVRGNSVKVEVDVDIAKALKAQGYKWSGHTHSGTSVVPSDGDFLVLKAFDQQRSAIYNSLGQYEVFGGA